MSYLNPLEILLTLLVLLFVDRLPVNGEVVVLFPPLFIVRSQFSDPLPLSKILADEPIDVSTVARGAVRSESVDPVLPKDKIMYINKNITFIKK